MAILLLSLFIPTWAQIGGDYDPNNPDDPGTPVLKYTLSLIAEPASSGSFNISNERIAAGRNNSLRAYTNTDFTFKHWMIGDSILSTNPNLDFVMPSHNVQIVGVFEYNPTNPTNPNANFWNQETGEVIIDDFAPGNLSNAIYTSVGDASRNQVSVITVAGIMNDNDFGIANNYKNCSILDLSRVTGITEIPSYAFDYTNLESIYLPATIEKIGQRAFYNCQQLSSLIIYAMAPPTLESNVFQGVSEGLVVSVPAAALGQYQDDETWGKYTLLPILEDIRNISVSLPNGTNVQDYAQMWLELTNTKNGQRIHYVMTDKTQYTFPNIIRNTSWNIVLRNEHGDVFGKIDNVEVKDDNVSVMFASLSKPQNVSLSVLTPDGNNVTGEVQVTWTDASGNYLAQSASLSGLPVGYQANYRVTLSQELAMMYNTPQVVEYTLKNGGNNLTCQLKAIKQVQLSGKVKDATTGLPLSGVVISASQTYGGKYSKTQNAKTDKNGVYEITIPDVPTSLAFAASDYISKTMACDSLMDGETAVALPEVSLKPITGATITVGFSYTTVEGDTQNWYSDYQNISYELFNVTKNSFISQYNVQYPQIVLLEDIEDGDVLKLTASSRTNAFMAVETNTTIANQKADATFAIIELGKIQASFEKNGNASVVGSLYDASGKLVNTYIYSNAMLTISNLDDGQYTLVSMGNSRMFNTIYDLAKLPQTGLVEGLDYVKNKVEVQSGSITKITISEVPKLDESKLYYTGNYTSFTVNKPNIVAGHYLTLTGRIDFKPDYAAKIGNVQMIVDLPESCHFVENSVMVGNSTSMYTQNGNQITIPLTQYTDRVRFCVIPTLEGNYAPSAFVQFELNGETITQPIGNAEFTSDGLSISSPSTVNKTNIPISGTAVGVCDVSIYDNDVLIGQTKSLANGSWAMNCELNNAYNLSRHSIHAKIMTSQGLELQTETSNTYYDINSAQVVKVTQYNEQRGPTPYLMTFDFMNPSTTSQHYSYDMYDNNKTFTYTIEFTNNKAVDNVTLYVKTNMGHWWPLKARYDEEKDLWVAAGEFGDSQNGDLPVNVSVDFVSNSKTKVDRGHFDADIEALKDKREEVLLTRDSIQNINDMMSKNEVEAQLENSLLNIIGDKIDDELLKDNTDYNLVDELLASFLSTTGTEYPVSVFKAEEVDVWDKDMLIKITEKTDKLLAIEDQTEALLETGRTLLATSMKITTDEKNVEYETALFKTESDTIYFDDDGEAMMFYEMDFEQFKLLELNKDNAIELAMTDSSIVYVYDNDGNFVIVDERNKRVWTIERTEVINRKRELARRDVNIIDELRKTITKIQNVINDITTFANGLADPIREDIRLIEEEIAKNNNWEIFYKQQNIQLEEQIISIEKQIHELNQLPSPTTYGELYSESGIKYQDLQTKRSQLEQQLAQKRNKIKSLKAEHRQLEKEVANLKKSRILKLGVLNNIMDIIQIGQGLWQVIDIITYEILDLNKWTSFIGSINENYNCKTKEESDALKIQAKALKTKSQEDHDRFGLRYTSSCAITFVSTAINGALAFNKGIGWIVKMLTSNISSFVNDQAKNIDNTTKAESESTYAIRMAEKEQLKCKGDDDDDDNDDDGGNNTGKNNVGNGNLSDNPKGHVYQGADMTFCIDPSGFVYEGVFSNRLEGVTTTCFYKKTVEDMYGDMHDEIVLWDATQYGQENPLYTDKNGYYQWDVPEGMWQVKYEKEGYETTYSEWLPVPPPQLDVNIGMKQNVQPNVKYARAYEEAVEIEFDKYMMPEELNNYNITVIQDGNPVEGTITLLNEETSYTNNEESFASKVRFNAAQPFTEQEVTLMVSNRVKSYAGIRMQHDFSQTFKVEQEIKQIVSDSLKVVPYGGKTTLKVSVLPASASKGKTLAAKTSSPMILGLETEQITIGEDGMAEITVLGELPGTAAITFSVEGTDRTSITLATVKNYTIVATPIASIASGSVVEKGSKIELTCSTEGAIIYYTLDGSCPCENSSSRMIYDGTPIVVNGNVTIKVMAWTEGYGESDVADYTYLIKGDGVEEIVLKDQIQVYPLPVRDKLNVTAGGKIIKSVTVSSMNGVQVAKSSTASTQVTLDASSIPAGIYIVNVITSDGSSSRKVLKVE